MEDLFGNVSEEEEGRRSEEEEGRPSGVEEGEGVVADEELQEAGDDTEAMAGDLGAIVHKKKTGVDMFVGEEEMWNLYKLTNNSRFPWRFPESEEKRRKELAYTKRWHEVKKKKEEETRRREEGGKRRDGEEEEDMDDFSILDDPSPLPVRALCERHVREANSDALRELDNLLFVVTKWADVQLKKVGEKKEEMEETMDVKKKKKAEMSLALFCNKLDRVSMKNEIFVKSRTGMVKKHKDLEKLSEEERTTMLAEGFAAKIAAVEEEHQEKGGEKEGNEEVNEEEERNEEERNEEERNEEERNEEEEDFLNQQIDEDDIDFQTD
eukprot:GHVS01000135.1.p1 GENE.GHVS01000135.1~~GHVS01000135.1.p1  ORF type:complete len:324 (+),score=134.17 GHVS01000135.1:58-1029(+)